jgi:hypothetical protein
MSFQWLSAALVRGLGLVGVASILGGLVLDLLIPVQGEEQLASACVCAAVGSQCLVAVLPPAAEFSRADARNESPTAGRYYGRCSRRAHAHAFWDDMDGALRRTGSGGVLSLTRATVLRALCLLLTLGIALTVSLTSHAADWGDLAPSVAVDWAHMVAASAWTGGLIGLIIILCRRGLVWPPDLLGGVGRRFARLAGPCLLIVVLTGTYGAWAQLGAVSRLWTSAYGRVLLVKLLAVVALVGFGAVNRWCLSHACSPTGSAMALARVVRVMRLVLVGRTRLARSELAARFTTYPAWETLIALIVFACTGVPSESTPGAIPRRLSASRSPTWGSRERRQSTTRRAAGTLRHRQATKDGDGQSSCSECFTCHTVG